MDGDCDGWHEWDCPNTRCHEHPEYKLFKKMDEEEKSIARG